MATHFFGEDKEEDSNVQNSISLWFSLSGSQSPLFKGFWVCELHQGIEFFLEATI